MTIKYTLLLLAILLNIHCQNDIGQSAYVQPTAAGDGLVVGSLADVGLDELRLQRAVERIEKGKYGEVHSLLIYKDDQLVFEEYFQGHTYQWEASGHYGESVTWTGDMAHCIHSDTKSIVSLCIGIAIDKGFIKDLHQSIFDYLPDHGSYKKEGKEHITIEHLLTMTSGFDWEEWKISLSSFDNDQIAIWFHEDGPARYVLRKPLVTAPGSRFNY